MVGLSWCVRDGVGVACHRTGLETSEEDACRSCAGASFLMAAFIGTSKTTQRTVFGKSSLTVAAVDGKLQVPMYNALADGTAEQVGIGVVWVGPPRRLAGFRQQIVNICVDRTESVTATSDVADPRLAGGGHRTRSPSGVADCEPDHRRVRLREEHGVPCRVAGEAAGGQSAATRGGEGQCRAALPEAAVVRARRRP